VRGLKVVMNVSIASADWSFTPKQVVEIDDDLALAWIECGHASPSEEGGEVDEKPGKSNNGSDDGANKSTGSKKSLKS
jgi:hypothetical protein